MFAGHGGLRRLLGGVLKGPLGRPLGAPSVSFDVLSFLFLDVFVALKGRFFFVLLVAYVFWRFACIFGLFVSSLVWFLLCRLHLIIYCSSSVLFATGSRRLL